ncbi:MAG: ribonuclease III domain-containing protein [Eubacteriales bacterium]|jgi:ribonuclease-3 family protein
MENNFLDDIPAGEQFLQNEKSPPEEIPILVLAYLGDAVYDLYIRQYLIEQGITRLNVLHKKTTGYVRAEKQAIAIRFLEEHLSEDEAAVARRGRNAKSGHPKKGKDIGIYHYSTGMEALVGYLYLKRNYKRLQEVLTMAREAVETSEISLVQKQVES